MLTFDVAFFAHLYDKDYGPFVTSSSVATYPFFLLFRVGLDRLALLFHIQPTIFSLIFTFVF
jgi:hypothetical protein